MWSTPSAWRSTVRRGAVGCKWGWQQCLLLWPLSLGFPGNGMEEGGTEYLGNGVQRGCPRRCWVSEVVPHFICNLPELVFAHSAFGSTVSDRLPMHGLWHQFQLTFSCFSVQQLVASSTRYAVKDDNILVTLFCLSHHLHQSCFSTCSPLFFLVSAKA